MRIIIILTIALSGCAATQRAEVSCVYDGERPHLPMIGVEFTKENALPYDLWGLLSETWKPAPEKGAPEAAPMKTAEAAAPAPAALVPVEAPTLRRATAADLGCVIRPVMTDDDLRRCGATPPKYE